MVSNKESPMLKNKNHRTKTQRASTPKNYRHKRRVLILSAALILLLMTGGALAQWTGIFAVAQKSQPKVAEVSPSNFDPSVGPAAKEIIYLDCHRRTAGPLHDFSSNH
jgi:hypothetical protein